MTFVSARSAWLAFATATLAAAAGCSSSSEGTTPATDAGADASSPWGTPFADPTTDPEPTGLGAMTVLDASKNDVAPDFSCVGKPQVVNSGAATDTLVHLIVIGNDDSERVGGVKVDVWKTNKVSGTPDLTPTSAAGAKTDATTGTFTVNAGKEWMSLHAPASATAYEIFSTDIHLDSPFATAYIADKSTVDAIHSLIRSTPTYDPNSGLLVVRAADCQNRPIANALMHIEVDGALVVPATKGGNALVRSYFAEAEFPESGRKFTSRSGVAVFVGVPVGKKVRVAMRGRKATGGALEIVGVRSQKVADMAVTTSRVLPWVGVEP
jgi:hypothetical protein